MTGEWQDIETAPRDGRKLLLFGKDFHIEVGDYWLPSEEQRRDGAYASWWVRDGSCEAEPTHWQPLPAPPEAA